jgi:hypothetical protein
MNLPDGVPARWQQADKIYCLRGDEPGSQIVTPANLFSQLASSGVQV